MNEPHVHPAGDQRCLGVDDGAQQREIGLPLGSDLREMALDHVIGKLAHAVDVAARGEELEGADAHEARRHSRQYRSRQRTLPVNRLARGDRGECARRRNAERVHGLADQVFAQHRTERRASITAARIGGSAGTLQLDVAPHTALILRLAQQNRAAVAELRNELAELVAGIGHGDGLQTLRQNISGIDAGQRLGVEVADVESELSAQRAIEFQQTRLRDRRRPEPRVEAFGQIRIAAALHGFQVHRAERIHRPSASIKR